MPYAPFKACHPEVGRRLFRAPLFLRRHGSLAARFPGPVGAQRTALITAPRSQASFLPSFPPFLNSLPPPLDMPPARYLRETSPNWFAVLSYRCTPIPDGSSHSSGPIEGAAWRGPPPRHYSPPQRSSLASLPHTSGLAYPYTPPCPLPTSEARLCPSPAADRVWHTRGRRRVSPKAAPKPSPSCHLPAYL
jgi:hypothetical protein